MKSSTGEQGYTAGYSTAHQALRQCSNLKQKRGSHSPTSTVWSVRVLKAPCVSYNCFSKKPYYYLIGNDTSTENLQISNAHRDVWSLFASHSISFGKEPARQCRRYKRCNFDLWVGKIPWWMVWQPTPILLAGEPHGQRSLVGYSPQDQKESDRTEATSHVAWIPESSVKYILSI